MVSCADFLRDYSDYRDGYMGPAEGAAMAAHLAGCSRCSGYVRVLDDGISQLRSLPGIETSYDFLPRLQHRLYHLDEENAALRRRNGSAASAGFVAVLVLLIAGAAWLPLMRPKPPLVELPPVAATAPRASTQLHALFRAGPLLTPPNESETWVRPAANTLYFRFSRQGAGTSYAVQPLRRR